jgi:sensor protein rprX
MTHEFKTPISTISLAAQMLDDKSVSKSPTMLAHCSRIINEETKRLRVLVEQILVLSMFDNAQIRVNIKDVDANSVIASVVDNFKIKAEKFGGSVTADLRATDAQVAVDALHFTNVIYSLLDNAVKYRKEDESPVLKVSTYDRDGELQISIADNGIGIRAQDQKRIFDRFYRVGTGNRHDVKGYGIGLAYVRQVVQQVGGKIRVESELGKGTTFVITLPLVPADGQAPQTGDDT